MADQQPQQRHKGSVKWFNSMKGFGFVSPAEGDAFFGDELFVHQVSLPKASKITCCILVNAVKINIFPRHWHPRSAKCDVLSRTCESII